MRITSARIWFSVTTVALTLLVPQGSVARPIPTDSGIQVRERTIREAPRYREGAVLVRYREDAAKRQADRAAVRASVGAAVRRTYEILPEVEALSLPDATSVESALGALRADPRVAYAEPDFVYTTDGVPNDRYFVEEWGLHNTGQTVGNSPAPGVDVDINAPEAWDHTTGADDVIVAVVDEGIDVGHEDLAANAWVNPGEIPGNGLDDDQNGFPDDVNGWDFLNDDPTVFDGEADATNEQDFHGTHVGGTIGAVGNNAIGLSGVCWNVKLLSAKCFDYYGSTQDQIAAIDYVVKMKARGFRIVAINASWGGGAYSASLQAAIAAAAEADILFVAAAGNNGANNDGSPHFPSNYDLANIISVGAITRYDARASFSNFGATSVDLFAPGALIASTGPNDSYYFSSGTSMATPHVAGAVALVAAAAPTLDPLEIKKVLFDSVHPVPNLQCATGGRLDVNAAVRLAIEISGGDGGDDGGDDGDDEEEPQYDPPSLDTVRYLNSKKTLVVTGAHFRLDTSVIEVDGVAMPVINYPAAAQLPDGTFTQLEGKAPGRVKFFLPKRKTVQITVYDTFTQLRSAPVSFRR